MFESFIRGYYEIEYNDLYVNKRRIEWATEDVLEDSYMPVMESDLLLDNGNMTLIIDTKRYEEILNDHYGLSFKSSNIYQIISYVTNWKYNHPNKTVSGLLLYAETDLVKLNNNHNIAGNEYYFRTINLKGKWDEIDKQLRKMLLETKIVVA